jgi:PhnB protein
MSTAVVPYISVRSAADAIAFYKKAFDANHTGPTMKDPEGNIIHTEIRIGESVVILADENLDFGNVSPSTLGDTPVRFSLEIDNADAVAQQAVDAGAEIIILVEDQFYGYRSGRLKDPFGHIWILSQKLEDLSEAEMQKRCDKQFAG